MGTYSGRPDDPLARLQREQLADLMITRSRTIAESAAQMAADTRAEMAAVTRQIGVAFPVLSLPALALTIWSATRIRTEYCRPDRATPARGCHHRHRPARLPHRACLG